MTAAVDSTPSPVLQQFRSKDGEPLPSVQTHPIGRFGERFVYWSDIQNAFPNTFYLLDDRGDRVLYEVIEKDNDYELASPLRVKGSQHPITVMPLPTAVDPVRLQSILLDDVLKWNDRMNSDKPNFANSPEFRLSFLHSLEAFTTKTSKDPATQAIAKACSMRHELDIPHNVIEFVEPPRLFLFLPSDFDLWDDLDPTTHSFRLYFLCDCEYASAARCHTYVHISNHPGYDVHQPQKFIRQFGRFSLTILEAVKSGYIGEYCFIPKLETVHILHSFDDNAIQHQLTVGMLRPLIDKAITYVREQPDLVMQPEHQSVLILRSIAKDFISSFQNKRYQMSQSGMPMNYSSLPSIHSFLSLKIGDNGFGDLNRFLYPSVMRWICKGHILKTSNTEALEEYVRTQGGRIDLQLSTITVTLGSLSQADTFTSTLLQSNRIFDLSLKLAWNLSKLDLEAFLLLVSRCGVSTLEIDGATLNFQQRLEYSRDPFARHLGIGTVRHQPGNLITLFRYPQSSESYTYFCKTTLIFGFLFSGIINKLHVDWLALGVNLVAFDTRFLDALKSSDQEQDALWTELTRIVQPLLAQGLQKVDVYDTYTFELQCRLGVKDGSITGITEFYEPSSLRIRRSRRISVLRRFIIRPGAHNFFESLYPVIKNTPELKSVDIPAQGHEVFGIIAYLLCTWPAAGIVQVTLFEYNSKGEGLPLVKLHIGRNPNKHSSAAISIKEWNHDHVSEVPNSQSAQVLDFATQCPRTSLVYLALTISPLTGRGWK
ncbi:MAG: hypothetical protein BYD32DRAFT_423987 [Podila humilis]|nr:MAG: hypothetical protein BYD32DRAFT_423987 [Podila humilis]